MIRCLFNLFVPSILCVVALYLWVSSYHSASEFGYFRLRTADGLRRDYYSISDNGSLTYIWFHQSAAGMPDGWLWRSQLPHMSPADGPMGFSYHSVGTAYPFGWHEITVPFWFIVPVLVAAAVTPYRRVIRRWTYRPGLCADCGYDLCATPARCPECGRIAGTEI